MTKDSEKLLCLMYKHYLSRIKDGISKAGAKSFGGLGVICALVPNEKSENVLETCRELGRSGMLRNTYASNTIYRSIITDEAIEFMENRLKNGLKDISSFLSQFIP